MKDKYGKTLIEPVNVETFPAAWFAEHMRQIDKNELEWLGEDVEEQIKYSISDSGTNCYQARVEGEKYPWMLFGYEEDIKAIWALGTRDVEHHKRELILVGRDFIRDNIERYGKAFNLISEENEPALRYIRHAGAVFKNRWITRNHTFVEFEITGGQHVQYSGGHDRTTGHTGHQ